MGNGQSTNTERRNSKIFKVVSESSHSGWRRCHLDDYINYSDGNYKHVDFDDRVVGSNGLVMLAGFMVGAPDRAVCPKEGDYIKVDLDEMRNRNSSHNFSPYSCPLYIIGRERTDANGDTSILAETGGLLQEIVDNRIARAERIQQLRFQRQTEA